MSDESMEIINQAKSQARKESLKNFFNKNSRTIKLISIVTIVALIAIIATSVFYSAKQVKFSKILHQSLINQQTGQTAKAKENLKTIYEASTAPNGVRSLAALRYAAILFNEGKESEVIEIYLNINSCRSCDSYIKDLAGLLLVKMWMSDEDEVKKEDLAVRIKRIENYAKTLKHNIAEQRALLEMRKGNLETSYQIFELIVQNPEGSQALKDRATNALSMMISKGFEPKLAIKK